MNPTEIVESVIRTSDSLVRRLDGNLGMTKGITYSEYQLLSALEAETAAPATRVLLAQRVGLTPSGVTRALKPLEKLGYVETVRDERDARRSIAKLTKAGEELVSDARDVVSDALEHLETLLSDEEVRHFTRALALCSHPPGQIHT